MKILKKPKKKIKPKAKHIYYKREIPNATTRRAIRNAKAGKTLGPYTMEEFRKIILELT